MEPATAQTSDPTDLLARISGSGASTRQVLSRKARASLVSDPGVWLRAWFSVGPELEPELVSTLRCDPLLMFETRRPERAPEPPSAEASPLESMFSPSRIVAALRGVAAGAALAPTRLAALLVHLPGLHQRLATAPQPSFPEAIQRELEASYEASERARFPRQLSLVPSYGCNQRCSYCFVPRDFDLTSVTATDNLLQALDTISEGDSIRKVALFGGEPTQLPNLFELIDGIRRRGLRFYIATNGLAEPDDFQRLLSFPELEMVTLHIGSDRTYSAEQVYGIRTNVRSLAESGCQPILRYNVLASQHNIELLRWALTKLVRAHLSIALPFPSPKRDNEYVAPVDLFASGERLAEFVREASTWFDARRLVLAKPFPPCALQLPALMDLMACCDFRCICELGRGPFPSQITIQPDLRVAPCMALMTPQRLVARPAPLAELRREVDARVHDLYDLPAAERCVTCSLFRTGHCQGTCYAYVQ